jgi:hypothetical protein
VFGAQFAEHLSTPFTAIVMFRWTFCIGKKGPIRLTAHDGFLSGYPVDVDAGNEGSLLG